MSIDVSLTLHSNGVSDVPGFTCSGVACDVRQKGDMERLDMALIYSDIPCVAAGVFTQNDIFAAPVGVCRKHLQDGHSFHAIIANSGNANAATGEGGYEDAYRMVELTARLLGHKQNSIFVSSTGRIGRRMPMDAIEGGIHSAVASVESSPESGDKAARAILTSDTRTKTVTATFDVDGQKVTLAGMAKGAGMIQPNMATMLAYVVTDFGIEQPLLQTLLKQSVDKSFNRISIDGDMSTNDTVLVLSNGISGVSAENVDALDAFSRALTDICISLAKMIVGDGERISKVVDLQIAGAKTEEDAEKVARAIGDSLLVKTSWFGSDPNWGRVIHAAGYARVGIQESKLNMSYNDVPVLVNGVAQDELLPKWKEVVAAREFTIYLDLGIGDAVYNLWSTDLTTGYVDFNKSE